MGFDSDSFLYPPLEDLLLGSYPAGHNAERTSPPFYLLEPSDEGSKKFILCFHLSNVIKGEDDGCVDSRLSEPHGSGQFWKSRVRIIDQRCFEIEELISAIGH